MKCYISTQPARLTDGTNAAVPDALDILRVEGIASPRNRQISSPQEKPRKLILTTCPAHVKENVEFPNKKYRVIYADPPWAYRQCGTGEKSRGTALKHYQTMTTDEIRALPVRSLCMEGGAACFMWATFPNITEAVSVMEAWGFLYKTAAFIWVKKNRRNGANFWGMGAYTRANAEVCLLGVTPDFKAGQMIISHSVHQVIEAPIEAHSKKPDETRRRIVSLLGDVPRIELFARQRADGWDAWGNEVPEEQETAT